MFQESSIKIFNTRKDNILIIANGRSFERKIAEICPNLELFLDDDVESDHGGPGDLHCRILGRVQLVRLTTISSGEVPVVRQFVDMLQDRMEDLRGSLSRIFKMINLFANKSRMIKRILSQAPSKFPKRTSKKDDRLIIFQKYICFK